MFVFVDETSAGSKYWAQNFSKPSKSENDTFSGSLSALQSSVKSFKIENFYCRLNFDFSTGTHHDHTDHRLFPIASTNQVVNRACLIDEQGFLSQKYQTGRRLLKSSGQRKDKNFSFRVGATNQKQEQFDLKELDLAKLRHIQITHVLPFEKIVSHLNDPVSIKGHYEFLNIEFLSTEFKLESFNNGYILYRFLNASLEEEHDLLIRPDLIKDYAVILCDFKKHVITIDPVLNQYKLNETLIVELKFPCRNLYVLVEVTGRLSDLSESRQFYEQRKGLVSSDAIFFRRTKTIGRLFRPTQWIINILDFQPVSFNRISFNSDYVELKNNSLQLFNDGPIKCAYAKFIMNKTSRRGSEARSLYFLFDSNFSKGAVFLNGFNLGRYWSVGALRSLYVPDEYIYNGVNELTVFELLSSSFKSANLVVYLLEKNVFSFISK